MVHHPLDGAVRGAFAKRLPRIMGEAYEGRREQSDMSLVVASLLRSGGVEVIEAETGLGKSLAYLVPLVLHSARNGGRAVVSTYTRNLQRQLIDKDFPLACAAAGVTVKGVSLMGRGNYLCRRRAGRLAGGVKGGGGGGAASDPAVRRWLRSALGGETGEVDSIPGASQLVDVAVRASIVSPSREAACAGCDERERCFMLQARRAAQDSRVVVTNHAMLFSDLTVAGSLLGPYDVLVVDEAHHLEDVATDYFSISYSPRSLSGGPESVYSPELEEIARYVRAMVAAESDSGAREVDGLWRDFRGALEVAVDRTASLFQAMGKRAPRPDGGVDSAQVVYAEGSPLMYGAEEDAAAVSRALGDVERSAAALLELAEGVESIAESGAAGAVRAIRDTAAETRAAFDFLISGADDSHVFFAQLSGQAAITSLAASPVDVGDQLGAVLLEAGRATVLTSATLAVDGDFSFILGRLGLDGGLARTRRFDSPFDLGARRLVLIPDYLPEPSGGSFLSEAAQLIDGAVATTGRRALVLCTARAQVHALGRLLARRRGEGAELFLQVEGASREDLLEQFRRSSRGVLVGLASFWEGVDLPGADLELLVVLKLPFMVPSQPVTRARARRVEQSGESPFEKLYVPDVVLKLRQGMGRLIRTGRDRGAVLLLDRRLTRSAYGSLVLRSIGGRCTRSGCREETLDTLERYFRES